MSKRDELYRLYTDLLDGKDLWLEDFYPFMRSDEATMLVLSARDLRDAEAAVRSYVAETHEIWRKADERLRGGES